MVPRKSLYSPEAMLDVARDLLLDEGAHGATIDAISTVSGAPTGSIYHRFGSRDELVTRLWMRAVRRHLVAGVDPPQRLRADLERALRGALG